MKQIIRNKYVKLWSQRFDFNGKETEESFGLNISEMDFRQYDPSTGRFYAIDLLAEATYSKTPYHFAGNNPVIGSTPYSLDIRYSVG